MHGHLRQRTDVFAHLDEGAEGRGALAEARRAASCRLSARLPAVAFSAVAQLAHRPVTSVLPLVRSGCCHTRAVLPSPLHVPVRSV